MKAEEVVLEGHEYEKAVRTKNLKMEDILNSVKDGSLINKEYLELVLKRDCLTEEGFVDVGVLLDVTAQSKVDAVNKLLAPRVEEVEEYVLKVRGCMTVYPKVQCISFTIDAEQPTFCELTLSLSNNTDVPKDRFNNDLFLVVYRDQKLIGLTSKVLDDRYSTGMMTVNPGDEIMIVGMGTTTNRKKSTTEKAIIIEENNKLSKRFKYALMNIFDSFDVDQDGILNKDEMNFYTVACGDSELTDQDWEVYLNSFDNRDGGLTMKGFIQIHEMEAIDPEGNAVSDLWHSLLSLGYDSQLSSVFGCSYDIEARTSRLIKMVPMFQYVTKEHRAL
uniref:EF-hand domain-containing protein n=1 Tax=Caenorhabditis tropicalis TaxID=1561998 RepID=A0A1I7TVD3_9PELO